MKKKIISVVIGLAMLTTVAVPAIAGTETVNVYQNNQLVKSVIFKIGVSEYVVNNQTSGVKMDVAPFIQDSRTFVPVRFLGNALGVNDSNINWDQGSQIATLKGNATLQMTVGKAQVVSNCKAKDIDVAPVVVDPGRTMLPARYVAEGLGYQVDWDNTTQTVVCWPQGQAKPDVSAAVNYLNTQAQQQPGEQPAPIEGKYVKIPNGGYTIPANTDLKLLVDRDGYPKGQIDFQILLKKGSLEQQYADARSILSQTVDPDTVDAAISYAEKANIRDNENRLPPIKTFNSSNGMAVRVSGGDILIEIQVWHTN